jgi:hypothetical protein
MSNEKELNQKFKELCSQSIDDQMEFFLKSFIFALEDNWKDVVKLSKEYQKYIERGGEGKDDLNPVQAADFLQKNGLERTAQQRREEIRDIDLDKNDRISFIEYLLLHYKAMILAEYYKRTGEPIKEDLSRGGIGITGVGAKLLDELFTLPIGLDPELEKAIEEFTAQKKARENKIKELQVKASQGGVKGKAAENEIKQIEAEDTTNLNRLEITLNAAKKRAAKASGEVALKQKKTKRRRRKKKTTRRK